MNDRTGQASIVSNEGPWWWWRKARNTASLKLCRLATQPDRRQLSTCDHISNSVSHGCSRLRNNSNDFHTHLVQQEVQGRDDVFV